jgi:hypothetical protein
MIRRSWRLRDVLAVFALVLGLSFIAGAPTAQFHLPTVVADVGESAESVVGADFADEVDLAWGGVGAALWLAVVFLFAAPFWQRLQPLAVRDRGPPPALVTASAVTALGA